MAACLAAFSKLCALNECREEQTVVMNKLWREAPISSSTVPVYHFSLTVAVCYWSETYWP